jgi:SH3 domain-containing YSC84-like protein 1
MKRFLILAMAAMVPLCAFAATGKAALDDRLNKAQQVLDEIMKTPDKSIPDAVMRDATCIAMVPSLKKGAIVVGGEYGQGVVTCKTEPGKTGKTSQGWSGPVFIRMVGGSYGFQIGAQGTDLVLVAVNRKGMQDLLKSKFKIGADAAATAGPVGRNAQTSTDWRLNAELLTYSRSKGLLVGIDLDGVSVSQNSEDTATFYGASHSAAEILDGSVPAPTDALEFVGSLERFSRLSQIASR